MIIRAGVVVGLVVLVTALVGTSAPARLSLGVYKFGACIDCPGHLGPPGWESYARWLDTEQLVLAQDNLGDTYWDLYEQGWPDSFRQWARWRQGDRDRRLVLAVPMFVSEEPGTDRERIAACAAGRYDHHYRAMARNLRAAGLGDSILRIAWEAHGTWNQHSYRNNPQDWRTCWRRIATSAKSEAPTLRTNWNVGDDIGGTRTDMRDSVALAGFDNFYPGDDVVDEIGIDSYATPQITDYAAFFDDDIGNLGWFVRIAREHDKPLSFPEWGLWDHRTLDRPDGSRDDPVYIERMYAFMTDPDNRVAWASYFDVNVDAEAYHQLQPNWDSGTVFPRASARFRALFGTPRGMSR
jgi:hypothetical protein